MSIVTLSPAVVDAEDAYARHCAEDDLIARHPILFVKSDAYLISAIANPIGADDDDEVAAVAAIILQRRLDGILPSIPDA